MVYFLGRLAAKKQPRLLVEAWARVHACHPQAVVVLAGPDGDHTAVELAAFARSAGCGSSLRLPGPAYGEEKDFLLGAADVFVLPSLNENSGIALAEAMMAGCAVVTTERVASSRYARSARAGVVLRQPHDAGQLVSALAGLLDTPQQVRAMGERGWTCAQAELSWRAATRRLLEVYDEVVRTARVPAADCGLRMQSRAHPT